MTQYRPLSEREAIDLAITTPGLFAPDAQLTCNEIGDGNLNLVFHITDQINGKGIIIKQALPYAKVVGESMPLTLNRARIESEALTIHNRLCAEWTPELYVYDPNLYLTIMEDLSDHVIMRKGLIEGGHYPLFAEHIGEFLARTLFFTSDLGMNQQLKKEEVGRFINPELCKITEDLIFDAPYYDADTNNIDPQIRDAAEAIWQDQELLFQVALLRERFLTHAQALLHGDLHTGSIFVTTQSTKVIDPEFAYYGPMGFDIGAVIGNLLLNWAGQEGWIQDEAERGAYRAELLDTVEAVWTQFELHFRALWETHGVDRLASTPRYRDDYMNRLLQDTVGFAGSKIIRRIYGLAKVADINTIADPASKERAQRLALYIGRNLIVEHASYDSIHTIRQLTERALAAFK